jgi:hypothetical protein
MSLGRVLARLSERGAAVPGFGAKGAKAAAEKSLQEVAPVPPNDDAPPVPVAAVQRLEPVLLKRRAATPVARAESDAGAAADPGTNADAGANESEEIAVPLLPPAAEAPAETTALAAPPVAPAIDPGVLAELNRLNQELLRCEARYRELNERYIRNRAAALALGAVYLRIRNELSRLKKDPKQPRKLTDPSRLVLIEKTRTLIEAHELHTLSGGRMSPRDANANW